MSVLPLSFCPASSLVVLAHPDDLEFTCAGTLARWVAAGCVVDVLLLTRGQGGRGRGGQVGQELSAVRESETLRAARILGVRSVEFGPGVDGHLHGHDHALRDLVSSTLESLRPELLLTWSPRYNLDALQLSHPDHLACAQTVLECVYPSDFTPAHVWLVGDPYPDAGVDVSGFWPVAREALLAHASQVGDADAQARYQRLEAVGREVFHAPGCLVEVFRRVRIGL